MSDREPHWHVCSHCRHAVLAGSEKCSLCREGTTMPAEDLVQQPPDWRCPLCCTADHDVAVEAQCKHGVCVDCFRASATKQIRSCAEADGNATLVPERQSKENSTLVVRCPLCIQVGAVLPSYTWTTMRLLPRHIYEDLKHVALQQRLQDGTLSL